MMKLSVIVPVYNVEKYLPCCLDSLLRQGMESGEWEVICVNDGSPDNCGAILAEYEKRHPDVFKIITQENQGLGEARNAGMRVAQGEYIGFVDSDDYVIENGFSYLCKHFLDKEPDVLAYDLQKVGDGKIDIKKNAIPIGEMIFEGSGADAYNRKWRSSVWTKFYRRSFLREHDIWFERRLCEDTIFNFQVFRLNPYLVMTNCSIYKYRIGRYGSIMNTKEQSRICKLLDAQLYVLNMLNNYLQEKDILMKEGIQKCISGCLSLVYDESYSAYFSKRKWKCYLGKVREMGVNHYFYEHERGTIGKMLVCLKIASGHSYLMYLLVGFMYRNVFVRYILPYYGYSQ